MVPLTGPATRYESGLIKGGEEHLECWESSFFVAFGMSAVLCCYSCLGKSRLNLVILRERVREREFGVVILS